MTAGSEHHRGGTSHEADVSSVQQPPADHAASADQARGSTPRPGTGPAQPGPASPLRERPTPQRAAPTVSLQRDPDGGGLAFLTSDQRSQVLGAIRAGAQSAEPRVQHAAGSTGRVDPIAAEPPVDKITSPVEQVGKSAIQGPRTAEPRPARREPTEPGNVTRRATLPDSLPVDETAVAAGGMATQRSRTNQISDGAAPAPDAITDEYVIHQRDPLPGSEHHDPLAEGGILFGAGTAEMIKLPGDQVAPKALAEQPAEPARQPAAESVALFDHAGTRPAAATDTASTTDATRFSAEPAPHVVAETIFAEPGTATPADVVSGIVVEHPDTELPPKEVTTVAEGVQIEPPSADEDVIKILTGLHDAIDIKKNLTPEVRLAEHVAQFAIVLEDHPGQRAELIGALNIITQPFLPQEIRETKERYLAEAITTQLGWTNFPEAIKENEVYIALRDKLTDDANAAAIEQNGHVSAATEVASEPDTQLIANVDTIAGLTAQYPQLQEPLMNNLNDALSEDIDITDERRRTAITNLLNALPEYGWQGDIYLDELKILRDRIKDDIKRAQQGQPDNGADPATTEANHVASSPKADTAQAYAAADRTEPAAEDTNGDTALREKILSYLTALFERMRPRGLPVLRNDPTPKPPAEPIPGSEVAVIEPGGAPAIASQAAEQPEEEKQEIVYRRPTQAELVAMAFITYLKIFRHPRSIGAIIDSQRARGAVAKLIEPQHYVDTNEIVERPDKYIKLQNELIPLLASGKIEDEQRPYRPRSPLNGKPIPHDSKDERNPDKRPKDAARTKREEQIARGGKKVVRGTTLMIGGRIIADATTTIDHGTVNMLAKFLEFSHLVGDIEFTGFATLAWAALNYINAKRMVNSPTHREAVLSNQLDRHDKAVETLHELLARAEKKQNGQNVSK